MEFVIANNIFPNHDLPNPIDTNIRWHYSISMEYEAITILPEHISIYRRPFFRSETSLLLKTMEEAVGFIIHNGFVSFWPVKQIIVPSLWAAVAGDRPVPDYHDDPGHISWDWKDKLLGHNQVFYGRCLRKRNFFISLEALPYFYALSPNYGDPESDYLEQYQQGKLPLEAKLVYEALLREGPLDTINLRKAARLSSQNNINRFNQALNDLQMEFKIYPTGVSNSGAWHYSFIYDLVPRRFPEMVHRAGRISEREGRLVLLRLYIRMVGACRENDLLRLFRWDKQYLESTLSELTDNKEIYRNVRIDGWLGDWVVIAKIQLVTKK